ncbi:MAG: hypothetical protein ACI89X_000061 [Planctomycetota bacterium]|jgi:hypothetical protein
MSNAPFPHRMVPQGRQIRHDAQLGHAFVANVHRRIPHEHGAYFSVTNAQGFREDHDLTAPPPGLHVMCYGDSYAAGDGVNNEQRFSALLAKQLDIAVSNVAVPGHGPDQNVLQLESGALPRPDLILFCIAVHTIERIQSGKRIAIDRDNRLWHVDRPHFVLTDDGSLELRGVPVAEQGIELVEPPFPQIQNPTQARIATAKAKLRSRLARTLGPFLKAPPDPGYKDRDGRQWQLLAALVRRFHASADNVPVVVVPLPTARYVAESNEPYFQQRFAEFDAPDLGLHVMDVTAHLRRQARKLRAKCHYRFDGHFTPSGHELVASALVEQLQQRKLVPSATTSPVAPRSNQAREDVHLQVQWQFDDGRAQLQDGNGKVLAEHHEAALTGHPCRPGVLPLSAIHACLEDVRIAGPELAMVTLRSPCSHDDLVRLDRKAANWFTIASGWVRWHGAAEVDLRQFLSYQGRVESQSSGSFDPNSATAPSEQDDAEQLWLRERFAKLGNTISLSALQQLAKLWELATRAARESVLPTTAPLRRGRMAAQLARAIEERDTAN